MVRTVVHLSRTPLGFVTEQVFRPRIQLPERTYPSDDHASFNRYYDRLNEQLAAVPNVSYALSTFVPFWEPPKQPIGTEDKIAAETRASVTAGGPDYFQTLGIGLRAGRAFTAMDREGSEPVAIISESLAHSLGPQGALGRRIRLREGSGNTAIDVWRTIIGVVHDVHQTHADTDLRDVYIPFAQTKTRFASVYLRGQGSADQWLEKLRTLSAAIDPEVLIGPAPPLAIQAETELAGPRFVTTILSAFAAFAAALALMGIFAVTAYAVQQRQREIAIRMAVGATSSAVIRMFLRRSGLVLLAGILAGLFGGAVVSRILQSQLHGVGRFDAWTLTVAAGLLMFAGLIATWIPTRRGAQADPMTILRAE
jgi:putative ABC transport system permease protein